MRIMLVSDEMPMFPGHGGAMRQYFLLRELAKTHDIRLLALTHEYNEHEVEGVEKIGVTVEKLRDRRPRRPNGELSKPLWPATGMQRWLHYGPAIADMLLSDPMGVAERTPLTGQVQAKLREIWARWPFDVVQVEHSWCGCWLEGLDLPARRVVTYVDLQWMVQEGKVKTSTHAADKLWQWFEAYKLHRYEVRLAESADLCFTMSDLDAQRLRSYAPKAVTAVVPNGVEVGHFVPANADSPENVNLTFTGTMDYLPNSDATRYFCSEIYPIVRAAVPAVRLSVVGRNPPGDIVALSGADGIVVTGSVTDTRPYLDQAAVCVVPLRIGSGTRLKILEALAAGKAVVSTTVGAEGLDVTSGKDIILADTPAVFAQAVIDLLRDPAARTRLGHAGRALVERQYSWEAIGKLQEDAYLAAVQRR
ncbi:MAG: glycosyltransferase [Chloroflexi bacterium]|nr:glycosyltransferase [Chloroflexota bacterium]